MNKPTITLEQYAKWTWEQPRFVELRKLHKRKYTFDFWLENMKGYLTDDITYGNVLVDQATKELTAIK